MTPTYVVGPLRPVFARERAPTEEEPFSVRRDDCPERYRRVTCLYRLSCLCTFCVHFCQYLRKNFEIA